MTHSKIEVCKNWDDNVINTFLSRLSEELLTWNLQKTVNAPKSKLGFCTLQRNNREAYFYVTVKSTQFASELYSN